jgi:hypothetical protein
VSKRVGPAARIQYRASRSVFSFQDGHRGTGGRATSQDRTVESETPVLSFFFRVAQTALSSNQREDFLKEFFWTIQN